MEPIRHRSVIYPSTSYRCCDFSRFSICVFPVSREHLQTSRPHVLALTETQFKPKSNTSAMSRIGISHDTSTTTKISIQTMMDILRLQVMAFRTTKYLCCRYILIIQYSISCSTIHHTL